jgi:hypothetical protein
MTVVAVVCSLVAANAFAALVVWSAVSDTFEPAHPWVFALGAAGFASNLFAGLSRPVRVAATLGQAACIFELLGFSVAVTAGSYSRATGWPVMQPWEWAGTWGLLAVCLAALVLAPLIRRAP